jgi:signal transduction histidine kinase
VTIFDDGVGMPGREDGAAGLGLIGMRERIEALRGSLAVEAGAGAGFRITATIPRAIERSA